MKAILKDGDFLGSSNQVPRSQTQAAAGLGPGCHVTVAYSDLLIARHSRIHALQGKQGFIVRSSRAAMLFFHASAGKLPRAFKSGDNAVYITV